MTNEDANFTRAHKAQIAVSLATFVPFVLVIFLGVGGHVPTTLAVVTAIAIVAAAFLLTWSAESMQFFVSQTFALAVLALLQVLPEYSFEVVLAWERHIDLALAGMTGANRLLLGLGWPLIFFVMYFSSKLKKSTPVNAIELERSQSLEIFFLIVATAYSFVLLVKQTLTVFDSIPLIAIYASYLYIAIKIPPESSEKHDMLHGPSRKLVIFPRRKRNVTISFFLIFGGFVILFGAEPFINSLLAVALLTGISQFFFIQWIAPFLSEFPESLSAFYWASRVKFAAMAMGNLISSKVNQYTLLIATIPLAYNLSLGRIEAIPMTSLQFNEVLLTAAQSVYGIVTLLDMRFNKRDAVLLLSLFTAQFLVPEIRIEVTVAYFILAAIELYVTRKNIVAFRMVREIIKHAFKK